MPKPDDFGDGLDVPAPTDDARFAPPPERWANRAAPRRPIAGVVAAVVVYIVSRP